MALLITLLIGFLVLGFPIYIGMLLPALLIVMNDPVIETVGVIQRMFFGLDRFTLMAVPFFVFLSAIMSNGQIGPRLVKFASAYFGHLTGGPAIAAVVACLIFGSIVGAGSAAVLALGPMLHGMMMDGKYPERFSMGLILTAGTLAMVIPPGISMIVYGTLAGVSIMDLFMAGLQAGLIFGVVLIAYCYIYARVKKIPTQPKVAKAEQRKTLKDAILSMSLIVFVLGSIYGGIVTITEAAAVAAFYALVLECFVYRSYTLKSFLKATLRGVKMIAMLMSLIAAGGVISWLFAVLGLPALVHALIGDMHWITLLLFINVALIIVGMFLDNAGSIIILVPLIFPVAMAAGIDGTHLGIVFIMNLAVGMLTPPFGLNIFVGVAVFKRSVTELLWASVPYIIMGKILLLLFTFIPALSMAIVWWLR